MIVAISVFFAENHWIQDGYQPPSWLSQIAQFFYFNILPYIFVLYSNYIKSLQQNLYHFNRPKICLNNKYSKTIILAKFLPLGWP